MIYLKERTLEFAKESSFWLKLTETKTSESESKRKALIDEATQPVKIFK